MSTETAERTTLGDRFLTQVERVGNRLPQPFNLFLILFLLTGVVSTALAWADVAVTVPGSDEPIVIKGLFTGEGLAWFTANLGANYIGFPPLVTVVTILLAIGIAEKTGFLSAAIRRTIGAAPRWLLPYAVGFIGVVGSIMADSAFVVIPPLAAMAFKAAGRHPMAGLLGGFAATGAGYSTSIFPTSLDALFAGITTAVIPTVPALERRPHRSTRCRTTTSTSCRRWCSRRSPVSSSTGCSSRGCTGSTCRATRWPTTRSRRARPPGRTSRRR